jgi:hypothetical protein
MVTATPTLTLKRCVRRWFRACSTALERLGVHVTRVHYSSPIPASCELPDELFTRRSQCLGIDWNDPVQGQYLESVFPTYVAEVNVYPNSGLSLVDAAILHCMIRHHRPRRIVEVGGGTSTRFAAAAALLNSGAGAPCEFIAIEPFPGSGLRAGFPGLTRLLESRVQDVPLEQFADADMILIDSSHVVRIGGDVNYEILEILPRVKPGCLVHFHDILLPGEYWREWVKDQGLFWSEQYLLQAFLAFNRDFAVAWASRYMHLQRADAIARVFPYFAPDRHHITSFWIRRVDLT